MQSSRRTKTVKSGPCASPRYRIGGNLFISVESPEFSIMGRVIDIGMSGLSYEYIHDGARHPREVNVTILAEGGKLYLPDIRCSVSYNVSGKHRPYASLMTRKCGLNFGGLTRELAGVLSDYLKRELRDRIIREICPRRDGNLRSG